MTDEARAARNAYKRAWNAANKDKVKAYQARHWEKRASKDAGQNNDFYAPDLLAKEFNRLLQEKRSAGEILTEKPTPEQARQIIMQIFQDGMKRPEIIDK